ncbi:MAG: hypothetical protein IH589_04240 [Anaerolineales bacterium]|nr:hypothetical protein [Anaerolineales bacterium]
MTKYDQRGQKVNTQINADVVHLHVSNNEPLENLPENNAYEEITPFLIGVIIDLSEPMLKALYKLSTKDAEFAERLNKALNMLVEKSLAYCKTPESKDVLPRFSLFVYGFGLGQARKGIANFFERIGVTSAVKTNIPTESVRDLLEEIAKLEGLPTTPNAAQLNRSWKIYKKSIEAQILDMGDNNSCLIKALQTAESRMIEEMKNRNYQNPMLLVICSGKFTDGDANQLSTTCNSIKQSGIELIFGYIGDTELESRVLYAAEKDNWDYGVKQLIKCASDLEGTGKVVKSISEMAIEKSWKVPPKAKLLLQFNQQEMLDELIDIIVSPLK